MILINEKYVTGLIKSYKYNELIFNWNDWVACKIAFEKTNVIHWCIASSFRESRNDISMSIWNPSYEEIKDFVSLNSLYYFEPVRVIEEVRDYFPR